MGNTDRTYIDKRVKMKVLVLFTFLFSTSLAFEVNLNPESDRGLCCLFFNAQSDCATRCSGRSCTDQCNVNCGIANTLCGSWTCSQVTSACTTETTTVAATTTTTACAVVTGLAIGASCCSASPNPCVDGAFCNLFAGGDAGTGSGTCTSL